tara:strand:+ start:21342 stop:21710 length:369 start_codon:yes stop_codon:yes gene_type:complete
MNEEQKRTRGLPSDRRGTVLVVIVVVMAMLALVVAGSIRPVREEADLATMRVETARAFYGAESGGVILMNAIIGRAQMPIEGDEIVLGGQRIGFMQVPGEDGVAIVEGTSGDARRRVEFTVR